MRFIFALALCFAVVAAAPKNPQKIVGGSVTTIDQYPSIVSLLYSWNSVTFWQTCGGTIINTRFILTTAHCIAGDAIGRWRVRAGSTYANSGGVLYNVNSIITHGQFDSRTYENDISMIRTAVVIIHNNDRLPAALAGENYFLADDQTVWAAGWGFAYIVGTPSEQLRHVQIRTVNWNECIERYATIGKAVTDNMFCSGYLDVGGQDRCQGDNGGPLYHNGIVVGLFSWGYDCAHPYFPSVNVRVARYIAWIHANSANV